MKFYWTMPRGLNPYYHQTLEKYNTEMAANNFQLAWQQLERAHILGQSWFKQHTYVHWLMLKFGIKIKNRKEILGQIPRLLLGGVKSFVGVIPTGNTGGANVPPLKVMEIPEDLKKIIDSHKH